MQIASILGSDSDAAERTGGSAWREDIRELDNYARRDMRDARTQRLKTYPVNGKGHIQRTVPLVSRLARELASAYRRPPSRAWRYINADGSPGELVTGSLLARLRKLYRDARVNKRMKRAHEQRATLHNATLWVWPEPTPGKTPVRVVSISPHEQWVEMSDPTGQDESDIKLWRFRIPLKHDLETDQVSYGTAEVTASKAYWLVAPDPFQGRGVYAESSTENPFGEIPVVMLRGSEPRAGEWWSPVPKDLLDAQRAINHDFTDVGEIARKQGWGQPVRKGGSPTGTQGATKELQVGIETAVEVEGDGDFFFASADPKLEGYVTQLRQYLEAVIATNEMSPETLLKAQGLTALAKRLSLIDRDDARAEALEDLQRAEQRLYDLMRKAVNWATKTDLLPELIVEVEYYEPLVPTDPMADTQADGMDIDRRFTSTARVRARRDGISLDEAKRRIEEDDAYERERGAAKSGPAAGADGVSTVVAAGGATDVQKTALNGAQVDAMMRVIEAVAAKRTPSDTARGILLAAFPLTDAEVSAMLAPLDGFEPAEAAPSAAPGTAPAQPDGSSDPATDAASADQGHDPEDTE